MKEGGRASSAWWRSICRLREGVGEGRANWFDSNTRRVVGNGRRTLFWHDIWVGDVPLKLKFPRIFDLSVHKECSVEKMRRLLGAVDGGRGCGVGVCWRGRRRVCGSVPCYF